MIPRRTLITTIPLAAFTTWATPAAQAVTFTDVPTTRVFYQEITWATNNKYITGHPDGTFKPTSPIDRQTLTTVFYNYWGKPAYAPPAVPYFTDVSISHPQYKEISWCVKQNLVTGWPDKTFRPTSLVTRDAAAAFFYRLAGSPTYTSPAQSAFTDVPLTHPYYREIHWLADMKITTGYPGATYRPQEAIQRDAICAFLYRFSQIFG